MQQAKVGNGWSGPLLVGVMLIYHLFTISRPLQEGLFILSVVAVGSLTDLAYSIFGMIDYASPFPFLPWFSPIWVSAIWVLFAMCINHSLQWLNRSKIVASLLGAGGAVLSYLAGVKVGAIEFLVPPLNALIVIGFVWAVVMPLSLVYASWFMEKK